MNKQADQNMYLADNYAPVDTEWPITDLDVKGELPEGLNGSLYRNGPNPQFPPRSPKHHWFLGDGMVHAIHLQDGQASYTNQWVRTQKFEVEREAGEALLDTSFGAGDADPRAEGIPLNVANTNIVYHAGKLLALDEGSSPVELDEQSLKTIGPWTFGGAYDGAMTAHPRMDDKTGEMILFAYFGGDFPGDPKVALTWVNKAGEVTRKEILEVPYCAMIHDFLITENYIVLPIFPATVDLDRIAKGGPLIAWDDTKRSYLAVIRRNGAMSDTKWFETDPCYVYHPFNAYEEGSKVICDMVQYDTSPLFSDQGGTTEGIAQNSSDIVRWSVDLNGSTNEIKREKLQDIGSEFPRIDDRLTGRAHSHGFINTRQIKSNRNGPFDSITHVNFGTGGLSHYTPGNGIYMLEPVFAPRPGSSNEADGYIVSVQFDESDGLSELVVLDALDVAAGPMARAKLPARIPYGFHGNWAAR